MKVLKIHDQTPVAIHMLGGKTGVSNSGVELIILEIKQYVVIYAVAKLKYSSTMRCWYATSRTPRVLFRMRFCQWAAMMLFGGDEDEVA